MTDDRRQKTEARSLKTDDLSSPYGFDAARPSSKSLGVTAVRHAAALNFELVIHAGKAV